MDHKSAAVGKYFNFDVAEMDVLLGTSSWSVTVANLHSRAHGPVEVKLWRGVQGGTAHGRLSTIAAVVANYWKAGDELVDPAQVPFIGLHPHPSCCPCLGLYAV